MEGKFVCLEDVCGEMSADQEDPGGPSSNRQYQKIQEAIASVDYVLCQLISSNVFEVQYHFAFISAA